MNGESVPGMGDELEQMLEGGDVAGSPLSSLLGSARAGMPSADGFTIVAGAAGASALLGGVAALSGSGGTAAAAGAGAAGAAGAGGAAGAAGVAGATGAAGLIGGMGVGTMVAVAATVGVVATAVVGGVALNSNGIDDPAAPVPATSENIEPTGEQVTDTNSPAEETSETSETSSTSETSETSSTSESKPSDTSAPAGETGAVLDSPPTPEGPANSNVELEQQVPVAPESEAATPPIEPQIEGTEADPEASAGGYAPDVKKASEKPARPTIPTLSATFVPPQSSPVEDESTTESTLPPEVTVKSSAPTTAPASTAPTSESTSETTTTRTSERTTTRTSERTTTRTSERTTTRTSERTATSAPTSARVTATSVSSSPSATAQDTPATSETTVGTGHSHCSFGATWTVCVFVEPSDYAPATTTSISSSLAPTSQRIGTSRTEMAVQSTPATQVADTTTTKSSEVPVAADTRAADESDSETATATTAGGQSDDGPDDGTREPSPASPAATTAVRAERRATRSRGAGAVAR